MKRFQRTPTSPERHRGGVAAIEFAVCIPLFVVLTIGAVEATDAIYLRNSLRVVAYEAVREAVKPAATNATATARGNTILAARNVQNGVITIVPADLSTAVGGDPIVVTVSAPANDNTIMPDWFFTGVIIREQLVMARE